MFTLGQSGFLVFILGRKSNFIWSIVPLFGFAFLGLYVPSTPAAASVSSDASSVDKQQTRGLDQRWAGIFSVGTYNRRVLGGNFRVSRMLPRDVPSRCKSG